MIAISAKAHFVQMAATRSVAKMGYRMRAILQTCQAEPPRMVPSTANGGNRPAGLRWASDKLSVARPSAHLVMLEGAFFELIGNHAAIALGGEP